MRQRKLLFVAAILIAFGFIVYDLFLRPPIIEEKEVQVPDERFRIAIVLDDFGYNKRNFSALEKIDIPLTLAVLPHAPYSETVCKFAKNKGFDVILHLPLQPEGENEPVEKNTINDGMDDDTVRKVISEALDSVSFAKGVSNHMGSKATRDRRLMKIVFDELKKRDLFFLDSYTAKDSVCLEIAAEKGVPYLRRDIFIDNQKDEVYIGEQFEKLVKRRKAGGSAVGIGHDHPVTVKVLAEEAPKISGEEIVFVGLSDLVIKDQKERL
ncbi:MAG: divergent polysaccharide deacetylase family protein [Candidatus Aadella gelida]|nr:divergent polysaccharide deacetylase family protein [Candidatus Aadella gelida]